MHPADLRNLLDAVAERRVSPADALEQLRRLPFEDIGFARIDHQRELRCDLPEVIFGQGKSPAQLAQIFQRLAAAGGNVLATRVEPSAAALVLGRLPGAEHDELARTVTLRQRAALPQAADGGFVALLAAGTSDLPVAEEARRTLEFMDCPTRTFYDVGVAGLHRLLGHADELRRARVLVVVAGMEGALPSVVGGLLGAPLIAVPTSVGYGASFGGLAALLAMLNSCAAGVTIVNVDNGFGAAVAAAKIWRLARGD